LNEKDIQLANALSEIFNGERSSASQIMAINTPTVNISRVNLVLLKSMLDSLDKQGIFITIDRPHQYAEHLLRIHGIDHSKLTFIDMISAIAGDQKTGDKKWVDAKGPFSLMDLLDLIKLSNVGKESPYQDLLRLDFLLFDNIGSLLVYNNYDSIRKFFIMLTELIKRTEGICVIFVIDSNHYKELYDDTCSRSDKCFDISNDLITGEIHRGSMLEGALKGEAHP